MSQCSTWSTRWSRPALRYRRRRSASGCESRTGLTLEEVASASKVRRATASGWKSVK
ncbi:hypothetical protein [Streptomyces sp. TRM70308]|uniref:hypothetical protein n=1 Tax=Streptomyces sp. TRM70308 TaxID=3131932 RepID=UPI003CFD6FE5